ncbi:MAG: transporter substrate-binding domain-containing protein [Selenomonadaceae bacterium]|nr:transporter substrate-binding domain-containing protein [Selenomonadaceae bacterium]
MKKFLSFMLLCTTLLVSGCDNSDNENKPDKYEDKITIGLMTCMNASEETYDKFMLKLEDTFKVKMTSHKTIFFDNLTAMLTALQSRQIEEICTYKSVARYIRNENPKYTVLENHSVEFVDSFCFALRKDDKKLRKEFDEALAKLKMDGTLDNLVDKYITNVDLTNGIPKTELAHIEGADTIKVAVTGDLPPMDYVTAEGHADGFNVALLGEIGKIIGKNFKLIHMDSGARAYALQSKYVDVVFWAIMPVDEIFPENLDKSEEIILTAPYYQDKTVHMIFDDK